MPVSFYEQISKYYDYIFPVGESQVQFISKAVGAPCKRLLDVACGSGGYTAALARMGYRMTATDVEEEMVRLAAGKMQTAGVDAEVVRCDMRELESTFSGKFDGIFCIGNSIVHLGNTGEILLVLKQVYGLLDEGGVLVLQTINYDRILRLGLTELPAIRNGEAGLEFIRRYEYIENEGLINFITTLVTWEDGRRSEVKGAVKLFPVLAADMEQMLEEAGFGRIQLYGDFDGSPFNENSYMLVISAAK